MNTNDISILSEKSKKPGFNLFENFIIIECDKNDIS